MGKTPRISHILSVAPGGVSGCVEALRGDDDPLSVQFLEVYDSIPASDHERITIEEVSMKAEIEPRRLLGLITTALATQAMDTQKLIVAAATPKIIAKVAELAQTNEGAVDREHFLKHTQFLPQPQGMRLQVNTQNNLAGPPALDAGNERTLPPPKSDAFLLELSSTLAPQQKKLEAPTPVVEANIPDAEYVIEGDVR